MRKAQRKHKKTRIVAQCPGHRTRPWQANAHWRTPITESKSACTNTEVREKQSMETALKKNDTQRIPSRTYTHSHNFFPFPFLQHPSASF